jgi:hypothetical protein
MGQMDEFYKGAELGLRVSDQRVRHTNLAERAAQTNRQLDISERQADVNMSRLNLLNKQLDYNMTQQRDDDNEQTVQLDLSKEYNSTLAEFVSGEDYISQKPLPMPPPSLVGIAQQQAIRLRENYVTSRRGNKDYIRLEKNRDDIEDLVDNFGLSTNWGDSPEGVAELRTAQELRALSHGSRIAVEMGVDFRDAAKKGVNPKDYINLSTGKLEEALFRGDLQKFSPLKPQTSQRVTRSASGTTTLYKSDPTIKDSERRHYTAKTALERGVKIKDETRKRRQKLEDDGEEPHAIDAIIQREFPPDGVKKDTNGNVIALLYIGDKKEDANGNVVVYVGGDASKKTSWVKVQ